MPASVISTTHCLVGGAHRSSPAPSESVPGSPTIWPMEDVGAGGSTGGTIWSDLLAWTRQKSPEGCDICRSGHPAEVIAGTEACWITAPVEAPLPGYVCVVSKRHVNEPYEMTPLEQAQFWRDAMTVAEAIAQATHPIKMNYEIHGNTLPHLHLHLFPRHTDDPYVGGPIDPTRASFRRTELELTRLRSAVAEAFNAGEQVPD
jgi:diadenosine tetraphosphate (Ap4A) HIT family hydrolase